MSVGIVRARDDSCNNATLRLLYHLPLRQAEGFLHVLFGMMRLDLSAPDSTTLSRRSQHLGVVA